MQNTKFDYNFEDMKYKTSKWDGFIKELSNLLFFWIFGVLFFLIYRLIFIALYANEIGQKAVFKDFYLALFTGFRFDCTAISYFMLIPLICLLGLSFFSLFGLIKKIRQGFQILFVVLSSINCLVTLNYYSEYSSQYNNFLFMGMFDDDKKAIAKTIVEYFNPVLNLSILIVVILACLIILRFFEKREFIYRQLIGLKNKASRTMLVILVLFLFVSNIRGTFYGRPIIRKWAAVTTDSFLNKTIINPYRMIKYAYDDYKEFNKIGNHNPYGDSELTEEELLQTLKKESVGTNVEKHKQIFLVLMESYDSWPLMDKYRPLKLSENLSRIADEGVHFSNFLPAYNATFYAYGCLTTGIPYCGVGINQVAQMHEPYITSIFSQFKKLGYKTKFFYGGFLSWQNVGEFSKHIQCDEIYSGVDMGGKSESGDWGVEDEKLFDLVIEKTDPEEYSLNVILTSSYHAPYSIDVASKGFPYKTVEDLPEDMQSYYKDGMGLPEMGHLWYGDWAIGKFMKGAELKFNRALYAFTGDHYGRRFLSRTPNLYERSSVPFIIYGKGIKAAKLETPGSHIDILPTLIELEAESGFEYYSFGENMFNPDKKFGFGFDKIITKDYLYEMPKEGKIVQIELNTMFENFTDSVQYKKEYLDYMRRAWSYSMHKYK